MVAYECHVIATVISFTSTKFFFKCIEFKHCYQIQPCIMHTPQIPEDEELILCQGLV